MEEINGNDFDSEAFLHAAKIHFPTTRSAIKALRRLGRPPRTLVDCHGPTNTALEALAALGDAAKCTAMQAVEPIKANWSRWISPWVEFFIHAFKDQTFSTPYSIVIDKISSSIPVLLSYPIFCGARSREEALNFGDMAPFLARDITAVSLMAFQELHWSWTRWFGVLVDLFMKVDMPLIVEEMLGQPPDKSKHTLGHCIRYFNHFKRCVQARLIESKDFHGLRLVSALFVGVYNTNNIDTRTTTRPFLIHFTELQGIRAVVSLCNTLGSQQTFPHVVEILYNLYDLILVGMIGASGIADALDSNYISLVCKTRKLRCSETAQGALNVAFQKRLWIQIDFTMKTILLYMVRPEVLRSFRKQLRRIESKEGSRLS